MLRPTIATLCCALSVSGCTMIKKVLPGGSPPPPSAGLDTMRLSKFKADALSMAKDRAMLENKRDDLRARRQAAWMMVERGDKPRDFSPDDARMLSILEETLDASTPWTSQPAAGHATLADLPRKDWWYLFVDPMEWPRGPLAFDADEAPGFYAAMMTAFDGALAALPTDGTAPVLTADDYLAMHRAVTFGVFAPSGGPVATGYADKPTSFAIAALHDPGVVDLDHLAQSLSEMRAEGLVAWNPDIQRERSMDPAPAWLSATLDKAADVNPHNKPAFLVYARQREQSGAVGFAEWLRGESHYEADEARGWVAQWLADYAADEKAVTTRLEGGLYFDALAASEPSPTVIAMLRPVCKLVRRLQVSHPFVAANGRLNTMLVLNRLLMAQGLPPATVRDTTMFGGRAPLDQLAREVFVGQKRFQDLVKELHAREAAPDAAR